MNSFHISNIKYMIKNYMKKHNSYNPNFLPCLFEYYSAIHLSKILNKDFYIYNDLTITCPTYDFPKRDYGIDLIDNTLSVVGQCKYYSNNNYITYRNLSTFLSSDKLIGKKFDFYLIRTDESKIDNMVKKIICRRDMVDICLSKKDFLRYIKNISD